MPKITLCVPADLGPDELARWRKLQREDSRLASPFLAPEFAVVLGRHRADVRVAVIEDGTEIVGFLPFHRGRYGVGRALGDGVSNAQALIGAAGLAVAPRWLLASCGLAVLEFDNLLGHQSAELQPRHVSTAPAPFVDLSAGWEAWLRGKRAATSAIKTAQRKQRKLDREVGELTFEFNSRQPADLDLLLRWKSAQFRRTGRPNVLTQPWVVGVLTELTELNTADFAGVLAVLSAGGRPVAMQQAITANGVLACWFPAYDVRLGGYSPGFACMLELVRAATEQGLTELDLAKGPAEYKETLGDGHRTVAEGWLERPSPAATMRRWGQAPRRRVTDLVLSRPALRRAVKAARSRAGRAREALRRGEDASR